MNPPLERKPVSRELELDLVRRENVILSRTLLLSDPEAHRDAVRMIRDIRYECMTGRGDTRRMNEQAVGQRIAS